jgi:hypothetical protein
MSLIAIMGRPIGCPGQVVVNEVMANVKGSESTFGKYNEFVELYNLSPDAVNLLSWKISDGDAVDSLVMWSASLGDLGPEVIVDSYVLGPKAYALILDRDYALAPDSEGYKPYHIAANTLILTTGNSAIGDGLSTTDPLILLGPGGDTVDTYGTPWDGSDSIPFDPGDGISAERLFPAIRDSGPNWLASIEPSGSTPGRQNSVSPYLGIGLSWEDIRFDAGPGEDVDITATIHNQTAEPVSSADVFFFADSNRNSSLDPGELLGVAATGPIDPLGGTSDAKITWSNVHRGCHRAGVEVEDSVCAFGTFRIGDALGDVIINEIMYDSDVSGEWIEIYNRSGYEVNLERWSVSDASASHGVCKSDVVIKPGAFAVVCSDSAALASAYCMADCIIVEPEDFPSLNNDCDSISLLDISGFESDRVPYSRDWGGRINVSLERVSAEAASDDRANWSSCVGPDGATPGKENSIRPVEGPARTLINISPNPFSPDGDGISDRAVISYQLPFSVARLRVMVYDRSGRMVKEVCEGEVACRGALVWDGTDNHGELLPIGLYVIHAEAIDIMTHARVDSKAVAVLAKRLN